MPEGIPEEWLERFKLIPGGYCPIETAADGDWFDSEEADRRIKFYELCLTHVKGELAGQPFVLEEWQKAVIGCTYTSL